MFEEMRELRTQFSELRESVANLSMSMPERDSSAQALHMRLDGHHSRIQALEDTPTTVHTITRDERDERIDALRFAADDSNARIAALEVEQSMQRTYSRDRDDDLLRRVEALESPMLRLHQEPLDGGNPHVIVLVRAARALHLAIQREGGHGEHVHDLAAATMHACRPFEAIK